MVSDPRLLDTLRAARTALAHAAEMRQLTCHALDECRWQMAPGLLGSVGRAEAEADELIAAAIERIGGRRGVV
jgi:hypothetical protein